MRLKVLGAAAGGGVPQWNCACVNCQAARKGRLPEMSQSSVAVSANGRDWAVLNASPDLRAQLTRDADLCPRGLRDSPVRAVVVTNADVDHISGLLTLREGAAFDLWATAGTHAVLAENPVFQVLDAGLVTRRTITLDQPFQPLPGLTITAYAVPGKPALFLESRLGHGLAESETTVGLQITANGRTAQYLPGCADLPPALLDRLDGADLLLFDGTVFADDDMARAGTGPKTGRRMGHLPISGPDGSLARLAPLTLGTRAFIHINNTNPALMPDSPARAAITAAGWTLAQDGQEFTP